MGRGTLTGFTSDACRSLVNPVIRSVLVVLPLGAHLHDVLSEFLG